ncbi:MAG: hydroxymethylglutaryl-CoA lyase [Granulosicoccus sp.]
MTLPTAVTLVEVGPRDGLQNESRTVALGDKLELLNRLAQTGLQTIETGSFVSPKWVPQMADTAALFAALKPVDGVRYTALVPNERGLDDAIASGVEEVALFAATTESFSQKNTNCSVARSLDNCATIARRAMEHDMRVRGYLSCVLGCPYEGTVAPLTVADLTRQLLDLGCYEVSLGDTIGVGTAGSTAEMLMALQHANIDMPKLAIHCHDTYGQAIANILVALQYGISTIDASVAGLGGCPYAQGATGNVATEDVVYLLNGLGITHGVDLHKLIDAGEFISTAINRPNQSSVARAVIAKRNNQ